MTSWSCHLGGGGDFAFFQYKKVNKRLAILPHSPLKTKSLKNKISASRKRRYERDMLVYEKELNLAEFLKKIKPNLCFCLNGERDYKKETNKETLSYGICT